MILALTRFDLDTYCACHLILLAAYTSHNYLLKREETVLNWNFKSELYKFVTSYSCVWCILIYSVKSININELTTLTYNWTRTCSKFWSKTRHLCNKTYTRTTYRKLNLRRFSWNCDKDWSTSIANDQVRYDSTRMGLRRSASISVHIGGTRNNGKRRRRDHELVFLGLLLAKEKILVHLLLPCGLRWGQHVLIVLLQVIFESKGSTIGRATYVTTEFQIIVLLMRLNVRANGIERRERSRALGASERLGMTILVTR